MQDTEKDILTPYINFPPISQEFVDEVFIRTKMCLDALDLVSIYARKTHKNISEFQKLKLLQHILINFVAIELFALFDGSSKLSIRLENNKSTNKVKVQKLKLKKLFPSLSEQELTKLHIKIETLIFSYKDLFIKLMWTRHNKIAHANISWYDHNDLEMKHKKHILDSLKVFIETFQFIFVNLGFEN